MVMMHKKWLCRPLDLQFVMPTLAISTLMFFKNLLLSFPLLLFSASFPEVFCALNNFLSSALHALPTELCLFSLLLRFPAPRKVLLTHCFTQKNVIFPSYLQNPVRTYRLFLAPYVQIGPVAVHFARLASKFYNHRAPLAVVPAYRS